MSQQAPETETRNRWDFSDIILSGKHGENVIVKHKHPHSDIDRQPQILKYIFEQCTELAYGGNRGQDGLHGPTGSIAMRDFAFEYPDQELKQVIRFRVNVQPTVKGIHYCMRRINGKIPSLKEQGYPKELIAALLNPRRRGLVLFSGEMGMGKTSAAAATISEWLKANGGHAITLEDPPEYNLMGVHVGEKRSGYCMQKHIQNHKMAEEIPTLMRAGAPEIIFLGEIRNAEVAREVVLAASNGHLVFSTIHGKGIDGALNRLLSLAATGAIDIKEAAKIISSSLSMVIYQELKRRQTSTGIEKILLISWMDLMEEDKKTAFANNIAQNKIELLKNLFSSPVQNRSSL